MPTPEEIIEKVKAKLTPKDEEKSRLSGAARLIVSRLESAIKARGLKASVKIGGSFAHGTWLPGETDIDVFLVFEPSVDLERDGLGLALEAARGLPVEVRYAEHPYLRVLIDEVWVEIVPCYHVRRGEWISAADRSPYHTDYLNSKLNDELRSEIRVTKAFMKAQGVYGAEIKVKGFSGYLAEVLTLAYGGFLNLAKAATEWRMGEVVSLEKPEIDVRKLHKGSPLIVPDPVDHRRNLAAALSASKLGRFILACERFISNPSEEHFTRFTGSSPVGLNEVLGRLLAVIFDKPDKPEDILWGEIWKTIRGIARQLGKKGFKPIRFSAGVDQKTISLIFLLDNTECCSLRFRRGPFVYMKSARNNFVKARIEEGALVWVGDDGRLYSIAPSKPLTARDVVLEILKSPVEKAGAAKGLESSIKASGKVLVGREILDEKSSSLSSAIQAILEGDA